MCTHIGLGSFPFARRYSGNRCFFLFLTLLRCFSSGGSPCMTMDSSCSDGGLLRRVSPFRNPRINGYLLLPMAYRSLSRLSSALSAKASAPCSFQLNQLYHLHSVADAGHGSLLSSLMKLNWFSLSFLIFDVFSYMWFSRYMHTAFTVFVEMKGFEPLTPCLQGRCSPN